jgi:hypothetical protein
MPSSLAAPNEPERSTGEAKRQTKGKALDRSVDPQKRGNADKKVRQAAQPAKPAEPKQPAKPAEPKAVSWTTDKAKLAEAAEYGLTPGKRWEFRDAKGRSSWVIVGESGAQFIDTNGKKVLNLGFETMWEVLKTTGYHLPEAGLKWENVSKYHEALLNEYYAYFRRSEGNSLAESRFGSGRFHYEMSTQHLADSVANELKHVFWKARLTGLEEMMSHLADANPGMECFGTTMLNVLKARGLVPPSMTRAEFETRYSAVLSALPKSYRHHVLIGGGGKAEEARDILVTLNSKLSKLDWARFTGMDGKKGTVTILTKESEIAKEVAKGYSVFVNVPGHFKSAIGGAEGDLDYDDPLGRIGHNLYDGLPARYGVVVE